MDRDETHLNRGKWWFIMENMEVANSLREAPAKHTCFNYTTATNMTRILLSLQLVYDTTEWPLTT